MQTEKRAVPKSAPVTVVITIEFNRTSMHEKVMKKLRYFVE